MGLFNFLKAIREERTYEELLESAKKGNAEAQYLIGDMYNNGTNEIMQDKGEALKWFQKSADQGNSIGQLRSGYMHLFGQGTSKNRLFALALWLMSAEQGNKSAIENLRQYFKDFPDDDNDTFKITTLGNYKKIRQLQIEEQCEVWDHTKHKKNNFFDDRLSEIKDESIPLVKNLFELSKNNPERAKKETGELYYYTIGKINGIVIFYGLDFFTSEKNKRDMAAKILDDTIKEVKNIMGDDKYKIFAEVTGITHS